jgi:CHAT domain-containing protein
MAGASQPTFTRGATWITVAACIVGLLALMSTPALGQEPRVNPLRSTATVAGAESELAGQRDRLCNQAVQLAIDKKWDAAIQSARQALDLQRKHLGADQPEVFGILELIAVLEDRAGQYAEVAKTWSELRQLSAIIRGPLHWSTVTALRFAEACSQAAQLDRRDQQRLATASELSYQADQQFAAGKYEQARDLSQQALEIRRTLLGSDNAITLISPHTLGTSLLALNDCDRAKPILEACAKDRETLYGLENPATLASLTSLAALYLRIDDPTKTRDALGKLLNGNSRLYGPLHANTVAALFRLGDFELEQDSLSDAESILNLVKTQQIKIYQGKHLELAQTCKRLGFLYLKKGDLTQAEENLKAELQLFELLAGNNRPDTGRALVDLAMFEKLAHRPTAAIAHLNRAIEILTSSLGEKDPDTIDATQQLASVLPEVGEYARAARLYRQVLQNSLESCGEKNVRTGTVLYQLGVLYVGWNDFGSAETCLRRALAIYRETLGESAAETAAVGSMLATVDARFGRFEQAEAECRQALEISEKTLSKPNSQSVGVTLTMGNILLLEEKYDDAEQLFRGILSSQPNATDDDRYHHAIFEEKLALVALKQARFDEAIARCHSVLKVYDQSLPELHPHRLEALTICSVANLALKHYDESRQSVDQALKIARLRLDAAAMAQSERQQMSLNLKLRLVLDLQLSLPPQQSPVHESYRHVLRWKGAVQARQIRQRQLLDTADRPLADELQATVTQMASLSLNVPDGNGRKAWLKELDWLKDRKETLEAELAARSHDFKSQQQADAVSPEDLQAALPGDAALVDVLEYNHFSGGHTASAPDETRYVAFIVRGDRPVRRVDLGASSQIDDAIESCRAEGLFAADQSADEQLEQLSKLIWEPLAPYLRGCRTVLYSPDGNLSRFPLAALPGSKPGRYLIEEYAIAIVPVPRMLPEMLRLEKPHSKLPINSSNDLLVIGNIDYDAAAGQLGDNPQNQLSKDELGGELLTFERLKSAPTEIRDLRRQFTRRFPAGNLRVLEQQEATEAAFRREAPLHPMLFIATHGFFSPPNLTAALATPDELVGLDADHGGNHSGAMCGLALTGANRPAQPDGDDGILTAYEVSAINLRNVDLVVLSGCETALGQATAGEGAVSMQRAFQIAGARATVASLWSVPDEKTKELMQRFLTNVWDRKMSKLEALRAAQISLLRGPSNPAAAGTATTPNRLPPYFWAAFIFSGDWR